jgi:hypothetical protein
LFSEIAQSLCVTSYGLYWWGLIVIWPKVSGFCHEVNEITALVAEGCSTVMSALAVCLTVPNTSNVNLTCDIWAWCICTKKHWLETMLGNIVVVM